MSEETKNFHCCQCQKDIENDDICYITTYKELCEKCFDVIQRKVYGYVKIITIKEKLIEIIGEWEDQTDDVQEPLCDMIINFLENELEEI